MLTDMLTLVCHIMAVEDPLFSFCPVGVGSHHDGTKVSGHRDLDFVLVSLYRPGERSVYSPKEGSLDRPKEGSIYRSEEGARDKTREGTTDRTRWALTKRPRRGSIDSSEEGLTKRPRRGSVGRSREKSIYRSEEGARDRAREGSTDRTRWALTRRGSIDRSEEDFSDSSEDFSDMSEDFSDRSLVDYRVECCDGLSFPFSLWKALASRNCVERGLLDEGRLDTNKYTELLSDLLSSALSGVCSELGLSFGMWNKPHFGGFEDNGPALTVLVDGVSVDTTVTFGVPKNIGYGGRAMEVVAERVSSRVSSMVSSRVFFCVSSTESSCVSPRCPPRCHLVCPPRCLSRCPPQSVMRTDLTALT